MNAHGEVASNQLKSLVVLLELWPNSILPAYTHSHWLNHLAPILITYIR